MSTFEDALEDQILRAEMIEELASEQRSDEDLIRELKSRGDRWRVFWVRMRMRYRARRMWSLT